MQKQSVSMAPFLLSTFTKEEIKPKSLSTSKEEATAKEAHSLKPYKAAIKEVKLI